MLRIKIDDSGDYADVLGTLRRLKDAVKPNKKPSFLRRHARDMEDLLRGIYDRLEAHAMAKRPGLAKILYSEVSGQAEIPSLKRIDKACREYEVMEKKSHSSGDGGYGGSYGSSYGSGYKGSSSRRFGRSSGSGSGGSGSYRSSNSSSSGSRSDKKPDLSHVECYGCKLFGHYKNQCPNKSDK